VCQSARSIVVRAAPWSSSRLGLAGGLQHKALLGSVSSEAATFSRSWRPTERRAIPRRRCGGLAVHRLSLSEIYPLRCSTCLRTQWKLWSRPQAAVLDPSAGMATMQKRARARTAGSWRLHPREGDRLSTRDGTSAFVAKHSSTGQLADDPLVANAGTGGGAVEGPKRSPGSGALSRVAGKVRSREMLGLEEGRWGQRLQRGRTSAGSRLKA
jgi:hypothetical protein